MPQMSPISWTIILISFTMTIYQMNSMMFFDSKKMKPKKKKKKMMKLMNWKW